MEGDYEIITNIGLGSFRLRCGSWLNDRSHRGWYSFGFRFRLRLWFRSWFFDRRRLLGRFLSGSGGWRFFNRRFRHNRFRCDRFRLCRHFLGCRWRGFY